MFHGDASLLLLTIVDASKLIHVKSITTNLYFKCDVMSYVSCLPLMTTFARFVDIDRRTKRDDGTASACYAGSHVSKLVTRLGMR